ncbi:MAG: galactosyltransferase-related protein [Acetobacteraceae bacterium]
MRKRLGVVVPYRDREQHLAEFLATVPSFLSESPRCEHVTARILIVEQVPGKPFNRGSLCNVGARILGDSVDYICLHDVDTLPIDADYSWPEQPSMIVVHGLKFGAELARKLFGTVVLIQQAQFIAANGFSNEYWDWGFEDVDLRERLLRCGFRPGHREGTFRSLPHPDLGSNPDGTPSEQFKVNQAIYLARWLEAVPGGWRRQPNPSDRWRRDGLNSIQFDAVRPRKTLSGETAHGILTESIAVDFAPPPHDQADRPPPTMEPSTDQS